MVRYIELMHSIEIIVATIRNETIEGEGQADRRDRAEFAIKNKRNIRRRQLTT